MDTATTELWRQVRDQHRLLPPACGLAAFNQVGILVDDLALSAAQLGPELGITSWYRPRSVSSWSWIDDCALDQSFEFLLGYCAGTQVELLKVNGPDRGIFGAAPGAEAWRLHHVGYFVRDLNSASGKLDAGGLKQIQTGIVKIAPNAKTRLSYWMHGNAGAVVELIEQRVSGLRTGMPEWLVQFGAVAGYFERMRTRESAPQA